MFKKLFGWLGNEVGAVDGDVDENADADANANADENADDADADANENVDTDKNASRKADRTSKFKEYKASADRLEKLKGQGFLIENEDGELIINPNLTKEGKKEAKEEVEDLHFKESEVAKDSWPLAQKINKMFDTGVKTSQRQEFFIRTLIAENAIIRDYPEMLQKDSPLKKKALDILKNDPEFKTTYRGNPDAPYYAVKRAAEALAGKTPVKPTDKKKSFIIGKGDSGEAGKKVVDLSKLSPEELDKLEREEEERINKLRKT